jgi:hypothetical protein
MIGSPKKEKHSHTPGPWKWDGDEITPTIFTDSGGDADGGICEVDPGDNAIGNARLIALAPRMLEAITESVTISHARLFVALNNIDEPDDSPKVAKEYAAITERNSKNYDVMCDLLAAVVGRKPYKPLKPSN